MEIRRATEADYEPLELLAAANGRDNPDAMASGRGFLTGRFDQARFAEFRQNLGILVAEEGGQIAGFVCLATRSFSTGTPILRAMFEACRNKHLGGRPLDSLRLISYGPVCVARAWQGKGVLRGLFMALKREWRGQFDAGVLFIDFENPHSLEAHELGLGMTRVSEFAFDRRRYWALAFSLDA